MVWYKIKMDYLGYAIFAAGGGSTPPTPTFQEVYDASSAPVNVDISSGKPISFVGPVGNQIALKVLSAPDGFTRVEGNSARFEFGAFNSLEPLIGDKIDIAGDLVPLETETYDIGRPLKRWRNGEFTTVNSTSVIAPTVTLTTLASTSPSVNVTASNGVTSSKYIVNGGTDQQYLMGDGSLLQYSSNSGNSNFYLYNSSQVITAPPLSGFIRYNNTVQDNATEIYISHLTRDNIDIDVFFGQITPVTEVYIQDQNDSINFIQYNVLATPDITPNTYVTLSVSKRSSGGTGQDQFPNGHNLIISFFTNGIEVDGRLTSLETKTQYVSIIAPFQMGIDANTNLYTGNILANADNAYDLGKLGNQFRRGYFATALRCPLYDTAGFIPLDLGTINAGEVNIGRNGITSTILGTTSINGVYTLPNTAPAVGDVLTCSASGVSNWIPSTLTTPQSSFSNYQLNFSQAGLLTSQNGFLPTTALTAIGGTATAITTTNASTRNRIFKAQTLTSSVADGQRSGYISSLTVNTWPIFFGRTGFILNIASGIGDTNNTNVFTFAVTQMFQGLTSVSVVPSFSSTLGPNTTPSIIGWGHDVGDSVISFYFRGTASGVKIATPFSTATPSPYWFNFNISNACNSDLFTLTLTDIISGVTATQNFTMIVGNTSVMSPNDRLFFLSCRGMAVLGGVTNSAISQFSKFGLSLK